ncbi:hypothetical protein F0L68_35490 [Solihabitans fulvus]|uniref:Uncharacterized protein n=1 Tax=Solihabitans fulvus TaxID=1892852 RepID=A0A5B2WNJ5_9PSEU|nr:hypothetical protein F0L68_35490 [Solihabitans fulvus]
MDVRSRETTRPDGDLRYRVDHVGATVAVLPATCKAGQHSLTVTGYRAVASEGELHVSCRACTLTLVADSTWRLTIARPSTERAELDDEPYRDVLPSPSRTPVRRR